MATHSSVLAWRIPGMGEPGGLPSVGSQSRARLKQLSSSSSSSKVFGNTLNFPFFNRYKSNEDYVYVRGRGRGKYICEECGIRCKKPSMLKKHIRTHTDVRPYVCKLCNFAFKTKGTGLIFFFFKRENSFLMVVPDSEYRFVTVIDNQMLFFVKM